VCVCVCPVISTSTDRKRYLSDGMKTQEVQTACLTFLHCLTHTYTHTNTVTGQWPTHTHTHTHTHIHTHTQTPSQDNGLHTHSFTSRHKMFSDSEKKRVSQMTEHTQYVTYKASQTVCVRVCVSLKCQVYVTTQILGDPTIHQNARIKSIQTLFIQHISDMDVSQCTSQGKNM
jgi:hypothetical protein